MSRFKLGLLGMAVFLTLFFVVVPIVSLRINKALNLLPPLIFPFSLIGIPLLLLGIILCIECVRLFFSVGKGTPAPIAPPKNLVTEGPFKYTRNPMVIGLFSALTGIALLLMSLSFLLFLFLLVLPFGILFIKLYEERDLKRRFGESYIAYKEKTPFLIPHPTYLIRWTRLFVLSFLKGFGKALLFCHLFFTFWRKTDECFEREDWWDREDGFWIPAWAGFFGQIQRVLFLAVPPMVFVAYAFLLVKKMPFILFPVFTQLIDIWVERRFLNKKIEGLARSMEE